MGKGLSNHHDVLYKVRLVRVWIRKIKSEKLRGHQYREGYTRSLEGKRVEWVGENNIEHMWEQVKRAMVESAWKVCGSVIVGVGNPKCVRWNDDVKAVVKGDEAA